MQTDRNLTCCFSGHRTIPELKTNLSEFGAYLTDIIHHQYYDRGIRHFICGGAVGIDMVAATAVANLKRKFPDITLTLAIPYHGHDHSWSTEDKEKFSRLLPHTDEIVYIADRYISGCMHQRNRYMVDRSRYLICYLRNEAKKGGTYYTRNYAKQQGIEIQNVYPFIPKEREAT